MTDGIRVKEGMTVEILKFEEGLFYPAEMLHTIGCIGEVVSISSRYCGVSIEGEQDEWYYHYDKIKVKPCTK